MKKVARFSIPVICLYIIINTFNCSRNSGTPLAAEEPISAQERAALSQAVFAGGCFWCMEAVFENIRGVRDVVSGYSGGTERNPTYEQVGAGETGHAESVQVYYDPRQVTFAQLLKVYFASIDPEQVNGQGPDHGRQYRSIVFYKTDSEKQAAEQFILDLSKSGRYSRPIAVSVVRFSQFWNAEDYHQNYVRNHPENPYVQHESIPRLQRTLRQVPELLKPGSR